MQDVAKHLVRVRASRCEIQGLRAAVREDVERPDAVVFLAVDVALNVFGYENVLFDNGEVSFVSHLVVLDDCACSPLERRVIAWYSCPSPQQQANLALMWQ